MTNKGSNRGIPVREITLNLINLIRYKTALYSAYLGL